MLRNNAKANWTLTELGWILQPAGDIQEWDGLVRWFIAYVMQHPDLMSDTYFRRWYKPAIQALALNLGR